MGPDKGLLYNGNISSTSVNMVYSLQSTLLYQLIQEIAASFYPLYKITWQSNLISINLNVAVDTRQEQFLRYLTSTGIFRGCSTDNCSKLIWVC